MSRPGAATCSWATTDWHRVIASFLDYLDNFARYKEEDSLHSIAALFDAHPEISVVEKALLGNTWRAFEIDKDLLTTL